jgi:hypothetical protein
MKNAMRLVKHKVPFCGKDKATKTEMSLQMHCFPPSVPGSMVIFTAIPSWPEINGTIGVEV